MLYENHKETLDLIWGVFLVFEGYLSCIGRILMQFRSVINILKFPFYSEYCF